MQIITEEEITVVIISEIKNLKWMSPYIVLARVELCWPHPRPRSVRHLLLLARLRPYHYHCLLHATPLEREPPKKTFLINTEALCGKIVKSGKGGGTISYSGPKLFRFQLHEIVVINPGDASIFNLIDTAQWGQFLFSMVAPDRHCFVEQLLNNGGRRGLLPPSDGFSHAKVTKWMISWMNICQIEMGVGS